MNTDIRLSVAFFDHPKTVRLRRRLGAEALICLQRLWIWAARNREDGLLCGLDDEDLEIVAHWEGETGLFVRALGELGFLERAEDGGAWSLHQWAEHQEYACKAGERRERARGAARVRHAGARVPCAGEVGNRDGVAEILEADEESIMLNFKLLCSEHAQSMLRAGASTAPYRTDPGLERRESTLTTFECLSSPDAEDPRPPRTEHAGEDPRTERRAAETGNTGEPGEVPGNVAHRSTASFAASQAAPERSGIPEIPGTEGTTGDTAASPPETSPAPETPGASRGGGTPRIPERPGTPPLTDALGPSGESASPGGDTVGNLATSLAAPAGGCSDVETSDPPPRERGEPTLCFRVPVRDPCREVHAERRRKFLPERISRKADAQREHPVAVLGRGAGARPRKPGEPGGTEDEPWERRRAPCFGGAREVLLSVRTDAENAGGRRGGVDGGGLPRFDACASVDENGPAGRKATWVNVEKSVPSEHRETVRTPVEHQRRAAGKAWFFGFRTGFDHRAEGVGSTLRLLRPPVDRTVGSAESRVVSGPGVRQSRDRRSLPEVEVKEGRRLSRPRGHPVGLRPELPRRRGSGGPGMAWDGLGPL